MHMKGKRLIKRRVPKTNKETLNAILPDPIQSVNHFQNPNPALKGARERSGVCEKIAEDDRTEETLVELLNVLPSDGQMNLVCDILARDDEQLRGFVEDLKKFVFIPCEFLLSFFLRGAD